MDFFEIAEYNVFSGSSRDPRLPVGCDRDHLQDQEPLPAVVRARAGGGVMGEKEGTDAA